MLRSAILRGPAVITFGTATFYSRDDIVATVDEETFEIMTSAYGVIDDRVKERKAEVTFTPVGEWESTGIAELWTPYATKAVGSSIFGTDKALTIQCFDGKTVTFAAAAVTKLPDLILSATKTMMGSVTFTCIGKENTAWSASNSFVNVTSGAAITTSSLDAAQVITAPWTAAWGGSPWSAIETVDGWTVNFNLATQPLEVDSVGILDYTFEKLDVIAKCKPVGNTESDLITAMGIQGAGAVRGRSLQAIAGANDLIFSSSGVSPGLTIYKPAPRKGPMIFGATANRLGEIEWIATRKLVAGVMQPLFAFA